VKSKRKGRWDGSVLLSKANAVAAMKSVSTTMAVFLCVFVLFSPVSSPAAARIRIRSLVRRE
jgi:hypothetical protein